MALDKISGKFPLIQLPKFSSLVSPETLSLHWLIIPEFFWAGEPIYFIETSLLKITFLLFYLRIFPGQSFRRILWALIFVNAMTGVTFVIAVCSICRPVSYVWNQWDKEHVGHCGDINALAFANAGISIILDIFTLILPITHIWKLHLGLKKRLGVILMFSVGAL